MPPALLLVSSVQPAISMVNIGGAQVDVDVTMCLRQRSRVRYQHRLSPAQPHWQREFRPPHPQRPVGKRSSNHHSISHISSPVFDETPVTRSLLNKRSL